MAQQTITNKNILATIVAFQPARNALTNGDILSTIKAFHYTTTQLLHDTIDDMQACLYATVTLTEGRIACSLNRLQDLTDRMIRGLNHIQENAALWTQEHERMVSRFRRMTYNLYVAADDDDKPEAIRCLGEVTDTEALELYMQQLQM